MKRGDMVRVVSGQYTGQSGLVIRVMGGWVDFVRADSRGFQERAEVCELVVQPDAGTTVFARERVAEVSGE